MSGLTEGIHRKLATVDYYNSLDTVLSLPQAEWQASSPFNVFSSQPILLLGKN